MRRVTHEGQNPRRLHENATSFSCAQSAQRTRRKPWLKTLEPILSAQPCLCAGRFTAADVSVGYALLLAQHLGLASRFTPSVQAYWQRLQDRAGFIRAMKSQDSPAIAQGVSTVPAPDTLP